MNDTDDLLPEFLAEASALIEKIYMDVSVLTADPASDNAVDGIFRSVHTIKGGAGMFGLAPVQAAAHTLETFLSELKKRSPVNVAKEELNLILDETQKLEALFKNSSAPAESPLEPMEPMEPVATADSEPLEEAMAEAKSPDSATEMAPSAEPTPNTKAETPAPFRSAAASPREKGEGAADFIRVPVGRINDSMSGIAEIFLIRNQIVHLISRRKAGEIAEQEFHQSWDQLDGALRREIGELERSVMNMRMAPVRALFSRMERTVQSYKNDQKAIRFRTEGESTELDKKVLDTLSEPLIHLVRNAMDHGVETREARVRAKKAPEGEILLRSDIVGNEALIEISDDGKGIDPQAILEAARGKGLDVSHVTDDASAIDLIFLPGFSTSSTVSDISGRGVGMDAVKTSVMELGGRIQVQTVPGSGSTFTIRLPVSVSVSPVVIVNINGWKYAVPNHDILEIRQTGVKSISMNGGKEFVSFRGGFVECLDLRAAVKARSSTHEETMSEASFLFCHLNGRNFAVRVSSFESNTEIVVKPASRLQPRIEWIDGVSVLPTGEPIFVLSLRRFIEQNKPSEVIRVGA